ncbi:MAG: thiamine ABC transporter substrate-binding protein [Chloroflexota bacterium]|nr:thiamine ABC transporter substrate-binding protein [Chloroflexota bacterium]
MRTWFWLGIFGALLIGFTPAAAQSDNLLTVIAHDSFNYSESVLAAFQERTGIQVAVLRLGDAGTLVNQAILTQSNPLGDVLFGIDNTFLGRALEEDLFIPYESPTLVDVPEAFQLDGEFRVTPIDYGDVCVNYDTAYFTDNDLELPSTLQDLTDPRYEGMLVVQNAATSSPGLAFLLATVAVFGTEGDYTYLNYWTDLVANDVFIAADWTDAYYGQFSGSAGSEGTYPLVVSYASSPPAEVYFAESAPETPPTGALVADDTCFRQIEFAGILNGTDNIAAAQQFIDFLLSVEFQADMPLQTFVFPVNPDATLPDVFVQYAAIPENPVMLDRAAIDANRDMWIQAWIETALR